MQSPVFLPLILDQYRQVPTLESYYGMSALESEQEHEEHAFIMWPISQTYVNKETDVIANIRRIKDRKMLRLLYKLSVFNVVSLKVHMLSMRQLSHYVTLIPPLRIETYSQMFHATGLQTE